jgi:predicted nucleic acid-binding protein
MANLYFDANFLVDLAEGKLGVGLEELRYHTLHTSPLSFHILAYAYKYKIPYRKLNKLSDKFLIVSLTKHILAAATSGPTDDLEDNIQLHSAVESECDVFLTNDKKLLKLGYFGKTKIASTIDGKN